MLQLVKQSLKKRPVQTVANILIVAIGVSMVFALYLLHNGVMTGMEISQQRLGADIMVMPEGTSEYAELDELLFTGAPLCVYMDESYAEQIRAIPGVTGIGTQFFLQTLTASCCSPSDPTRLIGIDFGASDSSIQSWLAEQGPIEMAADELLVGNRIAVNGTMFLLGQPFQIAKRLEPTGTSLDYAMMINLDAARALVEDHPEYQHFWERYGTPEDLISVVTVQVADGQKDAVARAIRDLGDLDVITTSDRYKEISSQMEVLFTIMLGAGLLAVCATVVQLFAKFFTMVWDRKGEWGLYRALGANRHDLKILILGEALLLIAFGLVIGLVLGYGWYQLMVSLLTVQSSFPFIAPSVGKILQGVCWIVLGYLLFGLAAAWYPMAKSSKIDPAAAIALGEIQ